MSRRFDVAKAYEKALFAGNRAETGSYFTDDVLYWVAGAPRIGGEWRGREAVLDALWDREAGLGAADWGYEDAGRDGPADVLHPQVPGRSDRRDSRLHG